MNETVMLPMPCSTCGQRFCDHKRDSVEWEVAQQRNVIAMVVRNWEPQDVMMFGKVAETAGFAVYYNPPTIMVRGRILLVSHRDTLVISETTDEPLLRINEALGEEVNPIIFDASVLAGAADVEECWKI